MNVYVGVDKENRTIKVGITKQTVKQPVYQPSVEDDEECPF